MIQIGSLQQINDSINFNWLLYVSDVAIFIFRKSSRRTKKITDFTIAINGISRTIRNGKTFEFMMGTLLANRREEKDVMILYLEEKPYELRD